MERSARRRLAALACLLGAATASCGDGAGEPPSFVLVTIDTLRADHLGAYGYHRDTSPALDALAADALLFEQVFAPMPMTLPSHVSLLTSSVPARHGVLSNFRYLEIPFSGGAGLRSVAQILRAAGYETAAFTSASPLAKSTGIDVGFDAFSGPPSYLRAGDSVRRLADETADLAIDWLEQARRPFFLWVHFFDPHRPYEPPGPWARRFETDERLLALLEERGIEPARRAAVARLVDLYDGEIAYTDAQLGRLLGALRRLGLYDSSVIVVTSDHGEALLERGVRGHSGLYQNTIAVPLVARWPGGPRGVRHARTGSLVDVLPTLQANTALPLGDATFDGADLLSGDPAQGEALAQSPVEAADPAKRTFALTSREWKYWHRTHGPDALYRLSEDPYERRDRIASDPEIAARLSDRLQEQLRRARSRPGVRVGTDIDAQQRERLRALGYSE